MRACDNDNIFHTTTLIASNHEVNVEVCTRCKTIFYWQKDRYGRIDNTANIHVNARRFLQPNDEHFEKEHGKWSIINHQKLEEATKHNRALEEDDREMSYNQENALHKII